MLSHVIQEKKMQLLVVWDLILIQNSYSAQLSMKKVL